MRAAYPLYEGDGYLHYRNANVRSTADAETPDWHVVEQRARELRREYIGQLFSRLTAWFEARLQNAKRRDVEDYLAKSTDHADLERRLKEVERGGRLGYC